MRHPQPAEGRVQRAGRREVDVTTIRQPLGVLAGITPFNFPAMVPCWMFATAIACGNSFVLKPPKKDPSASLFLADVLAEAGVPDGVFNVVQGDKVAVDRLLDHPDVAGISFVGSTPVARSVYERGTGRVQASPGAGGAKNHMVVLPDADVDLAADAAVSAAYGSAGERCMAISVVVAVGGVGDELVGAIESRLADLTIGPGDDPASDMGPLITKEHRDKVASYLDHATEEGATVVADGRELRVDGDGFFLGVSLVDHVEDHMAVYRDEIFGPVLSVVRVDTYDEALRLVDENPYGNGTAIFTRDGGAARRFQFDVQVGMVGINVPIPVTGRPPLLRGLEEPRCSATPASTAPRASTSHPPEGRHRPLARSGHEQDRPRLPPHPVADCAHDTPVLGGCAPGPHRRPARGARSAGWAPPVTTVPQGGHVFYSWSAQKLIDPLPVTGGAGAWLLGLRRQRAPRLRPPAGQRQHRPPAPAIVAGVQGAGRGCARSPPSFANDVRTRRPRLIAERAPAGLDTVFFTNGGAEAIENAVRMARHAHRPPQDAGRPTAATTGPPTARSP